MIVNDVKDKNASCHQVTSHLSRNLFTVDIVRKTSSVSNKQTKTNEHRQRQQQQQNSSNSNNNSYNNNNNNNNNNKRLIIFFSYDYLKIIDDQNQEYGVYCGNMTGQTVLVTGNYAVMIFHSDHSVGKRGFLLYFTAVPIGKYNEKE